MHPLTMQQVAQQQKQQPQQGQVGEINPQDVMPSGQFRNMDHSAFQISYPDNWQAAGDANSAVTIAPSAGVAQNAIAYGVIINGVRPQSGRDSLDQATQDLLSSLQQSNPGLRVASNPQDIQLNGAPGKSVYLTGTSPLQGQRERDWLVTLQRRDDTVLYLVFIAPERDFQRLTPTFEQMLRSLRIK